MDPITDMFNRIRNAQAVLHLTVDVPFSNFKYEIAKILKKENFVEKIEKKGKTVKKIIKITLKYKNKNLGEGDVFRPEPAILKLKRVSKPSQRMYFTANKIRKVQNGYGIAIISTSKGLMTDKEARRQKLGGEIICEIY